MQLLLSKSIANAECNTCVEHVMSKVNYWVSSGINLLCEWMFFQCSFRYRWKYFSLLIGWFLTWRDLEPTCGLFSRSVTAQIAVRTGQYKIWFIWHTFGVTWKCVIRRQTFVCVMQSTSGMTIGNFKVFSNVILRFRSRMKKRARKLNKVELSLDSDLFQCKQFLAMCDAWSIHICSLAFCN